MDPADLLRLLRHTVDAIRVALDAVADWSHAGEVAVHAGQHHSDIAADEAALAVLLPAGVGVLSEESGLHHADRPVTVVIDPLDGSTNAAHGLPWYAASLCAVTGGEPVAAVVANLASGECFQAVRDGGAHLDGEAIKPSAVHRLADAVVGVNGLPPVHLGWSQFRALGAGALDLCAVACGRLDGYVDVAPTGHGPWDYLGALLVCREAGAVMVDGEGRELVALGHADRRYPVAAATPELLDELVAARAVAVGR